MMLIEVMIGDSYGAAFEFKSSMLQYNDGKKYYNHPTHMTSDGSGNSLRAGQYTDDTQMSLAVAETILTKDFSKENFAKHFVEAFKRDPRKGYASRFYAFLMSVSDGKDFLYRIRPNSDKNGSAMRACPIGFLPKITEVMKVCKTQAMITHNTDGGIAGAQAVSAACFFLMDGVKKKDLRSEIDRLIPGFGFDKDYTEKVPCNAVKTARAALTAYSRCDTYTKLLIEAVSYGGDTDSTASIAMGIASCDPTYSKIFPSKLERDVENQNYGFDYAKNLDLMLKKLK